MWYYYNICDTHNIAPSAKIFLYYFSKVRIFLNKDLETNKYFTNRNGHRLGLVDGGPEFDSRPRQIVIRIISKYFMTSLYRKILVRAISMKAKDDDENERTLYFSLEPRMLDFRLIPNRNNLL